jgi:hypothetical protein
LKKRNKYISFFFATVIAFGVTVSSVHIHADDFHDMDTEHVLVEEELNCVICGSIIKFNPVVETFTTAKDSPKSHYLPALFEQAAKPFGKFKDGRAPPLTA